jgi:Zn-dependent protease/predicted transcriptional regulator
LARDRAGGSTADGGKPVFSHRFRLFGLFGIDIRVDASWLLLAVLVWWTLASGVFPQFTPGLAAETYRWMGVAGAAGLFASIIFHEMAHAMVARHYGIAIRGITLFIFGGVAEMETEPKNPRSELLMALAGPVASLALAAGLSALVGLAAAVPAAAGVVRYLALINFVLALFNLVPAFPLDGGRVLRAALWAWRGDILWASRIAATSGNIFGILLIVLGVLDIVRGNFVGGMWQFLIGMFLRGAAESSYEQTVARQTFGSTAVADIMTPGPVGVPPEASVAEFVEDYVYRHHHRVFPVVRQGVLVGQVGTRQAASLDRAHWAATAVAGIMLPIAAEDRIAAGADALDALGRMQRAGRSRLFVVAGERLVGVVTLRDLMELLSTRLELDAGSRGVHRSRPGVGYASPQEGSRP